MNFAEWKTETHGKLKSLAQNARKMTPGLLYGALSACAIAPFVDATSQGQAPFTELFNLVGGMGMNLLSNQMQAWHGRTDDELAVDLANKAANDPEWRKMLDKLLEKLDTLRVVQTVASEADKEWFAQSIKEALQEMGSRLTVNGDFTQVGDIINSSVVAVGKYITQIVNHYTQPDEMVDEVALKQQIRAYLGWVCRRYGQVTLRGIKRQGQQVMELSLENIYVPLTASTTSQEQIELSELFKEPPADSDNHDSGAVSIQGYRLIITGGPGSGKTTVLQHIAWTLATALLTDDEELAKQKLGFGLNNANPKLPLPIMLPLSAYVLHRRRMAQGMNAQDRTLAAFIADYLVEQQQGFVGLLPDFFNKLLQGGHYLMLLLDGLDEVPDESERTQVRGAIERLADGKTELHMVVTCRIAAYQGRTTLGRDFREIRVQALDEDHVIALVRQAYSVLYRDDLIIRGRQIDELLTGIDDIEAERRRRSGENVPQLIDSPLMIRLLLMVHLNERRFPQHRAELYMRATDNLLWPDYGLDDTDALEQIRSFVGHSHEVHRDLVQHIAWEMHRLGDRQGSEIDDDVLRRLLRAAGQRDEVVHNFLKLTRLRGTLLEERFGRFRFLHLAFQEYMVARYLAEVVRGDGGINAIVKLLYEENMVIDSWWREPILLIAGYLSMNARSNAQTFLLKLAETDQYEKTTPALQLAAFELAATACFEWFADDIEFRNDIVSRGAPDLTNSPDPQRRAAAGNALGRVGDLRSGVGIKNGLPDIAWSEVISSGPFIMGGQETWVGSSRFECNLIRIHYRISRYPITVVQYQAFIAARGYMQQQYWTVSGWEWRLTNAIESPRIYQEIFQIPNHPQVGISWFEAVAFCNWLSDRASYRVRLPTEAEWERAARHVDGRLYSWGNNFTANMCNSNNTKIGYTTSVGIFSEDHSVAGANDMNGNVSEWCSTKWLDNYMNYDAHVDDSLPGDDVRVLRGGSFTSDNIGVLCAFRNRSKPDHRSNRVGFRIVTQQIEFPNS